MKNRRIGVLMGGLSSEKSVSIQTGQAVLGALLDRGYDAQAIFVDRDLDLILRQSEIDTAFLALHGRYGEDGCIQGMLELMGIPYTGSDVLASSLAMNKARSKELFRLHNLPTPVGYTLQLHELPQLAERHASFGFPAVVKPINEGSSVGVQIVGDMIALREACQRAFAFDHELLIERFVGGQEVSVAVLEDRAIGAVEVCASGEFYDFAAKYSSKHNQYFIPPRVSPERYRGILQLAERAHRALGCSGATRVDLILGTGGNESILEVNTIPGLTPQSLLPKIAHSAGLDFEDLIEAILGGARLARHPKGPRRTHSREETDSSLPRLGDELSLETH